MGESRHTWFIQKEKFLLGIGEKPDFGDGFTWGSELKANVQILLMTLSDGHSLLKSRTEIA